MAKKKSKTEETENPVPGQIETTEDIRELSKYFTGQTATLKRSQIKCADYNPRIIDQKSLKSLKRGIRKFGIVGGIVVNARTGNTIIGGHQRMAVADQLHGWPDNDYAVKAEVVDLNEKDEKELNVLLNNPSAQGDWDYDKLRRLMPDIDYKDAGFDEADLSMIGCDFMMETEVNRETISELDALNAPINDWRESENRRRAGERECIKAERDQFFDSEDGESVDMTPEKTREEKIAHMKDVKRIVREQAMEKVNDINAYLTLSFDNMDNKMQFCDALGLNPNDRFIKGELLASLIFEDEDETENGD